MPPEKIKIELSQQDAELFKKFQEYRDIFKLLVDNHVFDVGKSTVILSISQPGIITNIDINSNLYRRKLTRTI